MKDMQFKAGHHGKDSMRDNARKIMGKEMSQSMEVRTSASAPSKLKPRLYKKGGHVKKYAEGGMIGAMDASANGGFSPTNNMQQGMMPPSPTGMPGFKKGGTTKCKKYEMGGTATSKPRIPLLPPRTMGTPKFAAGGVAKIRHNQATKSGAPKKAPGSRKGNPYC
jgi:hypothetical protein